MKRCPDCGFRAEESHCPLCGVRMQHTGAPVRTHDHTQQGEKCMLPNRESPAAPKQTGTPETGSYQPQTGSRGRRGTPSGAVGVIFAIILFSLLRACIRAF